MSLALQNKAYEIYALLAATESVYASGLSMSLNGNYGIQPNSPPVFNPEYVTQGNRATPPGTYGTQQRNVKAGRFAKGKIDVDMRGISGSFTTAAKVLEYQPLLLGCGLTATFASASWSFAHDAVSATPSSVTMRAYTRGEVIDVSGSFGTFVMTWQENKDPFMEFDYQGIVALPVDVAAPTNITYLAAGQLPPTVTSIGLSIGATFTGSICKEVKYTQGRTIVPRSNINNNLTHNGFAAGRRASKLEVQIESTFASIFDAHTGLNVGTTYPISASIGSLIGQNFDCSWNAQLTTIAPSNNGNVAMWTLTFEPYCSTNNNDDFAMVVY